MCVIPYKYRKISKVLLKLVNSCVITGGQDGGLGMWVVRINAESQEGVAEPDFARQLSPLLFPILSPLSVYIGAYLPPRSVYMR